MSFIPTLLGGVLAISGGYFSVMVSEKSAERRRKEDNIREAINFIQEACEAVNSNSQKVAEGTMYSKDFDHMLGRAKARLLLEMTPKIFHSLLALTYTDNEIKIRHLKVYEHARNHVTGERELYDELANLKSQLTEDKEKVFAAIAELIPSRRPLNIYTLWNSLTNKLDSFFKKPG